MSPIFAFMFDKRLKKTLKLSYEKDFSMLPVYDFEYFANLSPTNQLG